MTEILDGSAPQSVFEHIASCDACRDLRFDTERAIGVVSKAGADFRAPDGFSDLLVAAVFAARPDGPEARMSGDHAASSARASGERVASERRDTPAQDPIAVAIGIAKTEFSPTGDEPSADANATIVDPGVLRTSAGGAGHDTVFEGAPASLREATGADGLRGEGLAESLPAREASSEPFVPVHKTMPLAAVTPMRSTDSILWTVKFRNGQVKRFKFPVRSTPEGSAVPDGGFGTGSDDLRSPVLFTEPASLGLSEVVTIRK